MMVSVRCNVLLTPPKRHAPRARSGGFPVRPWSTPASILVAAIPPFPKSNPMLTVENTPTAAGATALPTDAFGPAVKVSLLNPQTLPLVITPNGKETDIHQWVAANRRQLEEQLHKWGAILFRGFNLSSTDDFQQFIKLFGEDLIDYKERSSPRHEVASKVYTSTDHPADQDINMHNENSYSKTWPLKIAFYCLVASATGGETPIADSRLVLQALSEKTKQKFREKGVMYVRNLGGVLGLDWKEVFQTTSPEVVEAYCRKNNMNYEWRSNGMLRLKYYGPAIRCHPHTGEPVWFNHAFFFNILSLDPQFVEDILSIMDKEDFSFLSYYGDGTEIEESVIEEIRSVYKQLVVKFPWQKGDILLVDNMLVAHGRAPFTGDRKVLVAMAEPQHHENYPA